LSRLLGLRKKTFFIHASCQTKQAKFLRAPESSPAVFVELPCGYLKPRRPNVRASNFPSVVPLDHCLRRNIEDFGNSVGRVHAAAFLEESSLAIAPRANAGASGSRVFNLSRYSGDDCARTIASPRTDAASARSVSERSKSWLNYPPLPLPTSSFLAAHFESCDTEVDEFGQFLGADALPVAGAPDRDGFDFRLAGMVA